MWTSKTKIMAGCSGWLHAVTVARAPRPCQKTGAAGGPRRTGLFSRSGVRAREQLPQGRLVRETRGLVADACLVGLHGLAQAGLHAGDRLPVQPRRLPVHAHVEDRRGLAQTLVAQLFRDGTHHGEQTVFRVVLAVPLDDRDQQLRGLERGDVVGGLGELVVGGDVAVDPAPHHHVRVRSRPFFGEEGRAVDDAGAAHGVTCLAVAGEGRPRGEEPQRQIQNCEFHASAPPLAEKVAGSAADRRRLAATARSSRPSNSRPREPGSDTAVASPTRTLNAEAWYSLKPPSPKSRSNSDRRPISNSSTSEPRPQERLNL